MARWPAYNYWFPKAFGFRLEERWGQGAFWCWLIGFYLAFMPLYALGLMGMTRRMQHYDNPHWQPLADRGRRRRARDPCAALAAIAMQLIVSIRNRASLRDTTGDPWDGRTLEWSTPSPPPPWNFAKLPRVKGIDAFWIMKKKRGRAERRRSRPNFEPIEMPKNTATGFVTAFFAVVTGFALIWHIWWMVFAGLFGAAATILVFAWRKQEEVEISAAEVARVDGAYRAGASA